jgi:hypothetical protein
MRSGRPKVKFWRRRVVGHRNRRFLETLNFGISIRKPKVAQSPGWAKRSSNCGGRPRRYTSLPQSLNRRTPATHQRLSGDALTAPRRRRSGTLCICRRSSGVRRIPGWSTIRGLVPYYPTPSQRHAWAVRLQSELRVFAPVAPAPPMAIKRPPASLMMAWAFGANSFS